MFSQTCFGEHGHSCARKPNFSVVSIVKETEIA